VQKTILIVDDQPVVLEVLSDILQSEGYETILADTGSKGWSLFESENPDVVLLDVMLPDMSGLDLLDRMRESTSITPVIIITAYSSVENAIEAMRRGAYHYIPKPFKNQEVVLTISKAIKERRLKEENLFLRRELESRYAFGNIIGKSEPMKKVFELISLAAPSSSTILIRGESGTGKELVAKAVHHHSRRAQGPFVVVNSGNIAPELLESHLFGHERGSFTGAVSRKKGLFEMADNGSIFFDEIGNIHSETQSKLLRVMQSREFMRLGGTDTYTVDVRIIAATNADLDELVRDGRFREDFYYRLNVISIDLPPLRHRKEDIPLLVDHFLLKYGEQNQKQNLKLDDEVLKIFMEYPWPGNVRELENAIERAVVLTTIQTINVDVLPQQIRMPNRIILSQGSLPKDMSLQEATEEFQRQLILQALHASNGVQRKAAHMLKVKANTLNVMLKRLNIKV